MQLCIIHWTDWPLMHCLIGGVMWSRHTGHSSKVSKVPLSTLPRSSPSMSWKGTTSPMMTNLTDLNRENWKGVPILSIPIAKIATLTFLLLMAYWIGPGKGHASLIWELVGLGRSQRCHWNATDRLKFPHIKKSSTADKQEQEGTLQVQLHAMCGLPLRPATDPCTAHSSKPKHTKQGAQLMKRKRNTVEVKNKRRTTRLAITGSQNKPLLIRIILECI